MRRMIIAVTSLVWLFACRQTGDLSTTREGEEALTFARKSDALAKTKLLAHAFRTVKDAALAPTAGLFDHVEATGRDLTAWVRGWEGLVRFVDEVEPASFVTAESELTRLLETQAETLNRAEASGRRVTLLADDLLTRLDASPRITYPLGPYQERYDVLRAAVDNLVAVTRGVRDASATQVKAHADVAKILAKRLRLRLRARILQASIDDVNGALARIDDLFLADDVLGPVRDAVTRDYLELDRALAAGRYFAAMTIVDAMRQRCTAALATVDDAGVAPARRQAYRARIETTCRSMEEQAALFAGATDGDIAGFVADTWTTRADFLRHACSGAAASAGCGGAAWLAALVPDDVRRMDRTTLAALESSLDRATLESTLNPND